MRIEFFKVLRHIFKMIKLCNKVLLKALIALVVLYSFQYVLENPNYSNVQKHFTNTLNSINNKISEVLPPSFNKELDDTKLIKMEKVVVGLVCCRAGKSKKNSYYGQTLTLLKSLLISAKLYNISSIEVHLFLEYVEDENYFRKEIKEKLYFPHINDEPQVKLVLEVHSAVNAVPKKYHKDMVYHSRLRCGYVRFFYSVGQQT